MRHRNRKVWAMLRNKSSQWKLGAWPGSPLGTSVFVQGICGLNCYGARDGGHTWAPHIGFLSQRLTWSPMMSMPNLPTAKINAEPQHGTVWVCSCGRGLTPMDLTGFYHIPPSPGRSRPNGRGLPNAQCGGQLGDNALEIGSHLTGCSICFFHIKKIFVVEYTWYKIYNFNYF